MSRPNLYSLPYLLGQPPRLDAHNPQRRASQQSRSTAYPLLIRWLFTAYSQPIHCLCTTCSLHIHCLFNAYSMPMIENVARQQVDAHVMSYNLALCCLPASSALAIHSLIITYSLPVHCLCTTMLLVCTSRPTCQSLSTCSLFTT
jgi:hypothetical protein